MAVMVSGPFSSQQARGWGWDGRGVGWVGVGGGDGCAGPTRSAGASRRGPGGTIARRPSSSSLPRVSLARSSLNPARWASPDCDRRIPGGPSPRSALGRESCWRVLQRARGYAHDSQEKNKNKLTKSREKRKIKIKRTNNAHLKNQNKQKKKYIYCSHSAGLASAPMSAYDRVRITRAA